MQSQAKDQHKHGSANYSLLSGEMRDCELEKESSGYRPVVRVVTICDQDPDQLEVRGLLTPINWVS
jgi:hypothetical protein